VQVNLTAALVLSRLVVPGMLERGGGKVVNVASLMGKAAAPYHAAYSATKSAMVGMTQALRLEFADRGIGFSVVCPGLVRDEGMFARIDHSAGRRAQRFLGTTTPQAVARGVMRAVSGDRSEIIVTPKPMRPLLALGTLFPRLQERLVPALGVTEMYRHAVDSAHGGAGPAEG
jgi:short-subunit dehydrogenase